MKLLCSAFVIAILLLASPIIVSANTYYVSPTGNDNNAGSTSNPWRTFSKANLSVSAGDTVIIKDGSYSESLKITKNNTIWRAENRLRAIIDGGFDPQLLQGRWDNIDDVYEQACAGKSRFSALLTFEDTANNSLVDGVALKNSCGRGVYYGGDNNTLQNSRIDWTFIAGVYIHEDSTGNKLLNNVITRVTMDDMVNFYTGDNYGVNVSFYMRGDDIVIRGNTIAWGRGEMASPFSNNLIFEDNVVVGMKNNFYIGWSENTIARNNLFFAPETENTSNTHWAFPFGSQQQRDKVNWRMSGRAENKGDQIKGISGPKNIMFYNNIVVNISIGFDGYHRTEPPNQPGVQNCFGNIFRNLYYGHNTIIARTQSSSNNLLNFKYTACPGQGGGTSANSSIIGIIENNIFDNSKNRLANIDFGFDSNDQVTIRNNVFPLGTRQISSNVYTNSPGFNATVEQLKILNLQIPPVGVPTAQVDTQDLRNLVNLNYFRLNNGSPAINAGSTASGVDGTQIPVPARTQDFFLANRIGVPDIGAIEFGGTPGPTNTPAPTPTDDPSEPTPTEDPADPTPSPTSTVKLPRFDNDQDTDWLDILLFIPRFTQQNRPKFDLNSNGFVDVFDFASSLLHFN